MTGLEAARSAHFDVVVLDIMLPGLNGYEVVRRMRAERVWTPVLMLTAESGEYDLADALDLGADTATSPNRSRWWCSSPGCAHWPPWGSRASRRCAVGR